VSRSHKFKFNLFAFVIMPRSSSTVTAARNYVARKRKPRFAARKSYGPRSMGAMYGSLNKIYKFKQCCQRGTITSQSGGVVTETNYSFALSDLPQSATFAALFDQYKIDYVVIHFLPRGNMNQNSATNNAQMGTYLTAIDLDDTANISTEDALRQFQTCKEMSMLKATSVGLKPHVAIAAYSGAVFTSFANKGNQWIDSANLGVPHYGVRTMVSATANNVDVYFDVRAEYYFSCKNVR